MNKLGKLSSQVKTNGWIGHYLLIINCTDDDVRDLITTTVWGIDLGESLIRRELYELSN